jgi:hypothetical protein
MTPLTHNDRRAQHRFSILLKVQYTVTSGERGHGELSNIGSAGLLFRCDGQFVPGETIDISLRWPYLLNGVCPLQLCIRGRVLRSSQAGTALAITKYEFRTARKEEVALPAVALLS